MDYLTMGTQLRERGVALIALGTFLIALAWHLLRNKDKAHEFLAAIRLSRSPVRSDVLVFLAVGACMLGGTHRVGEGGAMTTKGWHILGRHDDKVALLTALAREWAMNDLLRNTRPLRVPTDDPNFGKLHDMYPRFRGTALRQALTSGLFSSEEEHDRKLLVSALLYELQIESFNEWISYIDRQLTEMNVHSPERLAKYHFVQESSVVRDFMAAHSAFATHLSAECAQILDDAHDALRLIQDYI